MDAVIPGRDRSAATDRRTVRELSRRHLNRGLSTLHDLLNLPMEVHGEGAVIKADDGIEYLDCSGYGVFFLGHRHPRLVAAVSEQLQSMALSSRLLPNKALVEAAAALADVAPAPLTKVTFTNSGAEAVELAIKLGRLGGCRRLVAMRGGFHGKTMGALSATGRARYRDPFLPLLDDVLHVPFGEVEALESVLVGRPPAVVLIEPVQGEGGVVEAPAGYLGAATRLCRETGSILVFDEIQCGLGRTGRWWACQRDPRANPDILLSGKSLGGGILPCAAVVATTSVYEPLDHEPLMHSSTFAGNPLVARAVTATIEVIESEDLVARADALGRRLAGHLQPLAEQFDSLAEVRCAGLLIGLEFHDPTKALMFLENLLDQGVLACWSLNADTTVRLTPPAILSEDQADRVAGAVASAVGSLRSSPLSGKKMK